MSIMDDIKKWLPEDSLNIQEDFIESVVPLEELETNLLYAFEHLKFYWLKDICVTDHEFIFEIRYVLQNPQLGTILIIKSDLPKGSTLNSVAPIWNNATIFESEAFEMFGLKLDYKPRRQFFSENTQQFPLRKDFKGFTNNPLEGRVTEQADFTIGIDFPMNTNDVFFDVKLDHDVVSKCDLRYGYHHIGLEKSFENNNANQVLRKINLVNTVGGTQWTIAWAMLVEQACNIEIPEKAKGLRMILLELVRIQEHLKVLMQMAYKTDYNSFFNTMLYWYNRVLDQLHAFTNRKNVFDSVTIGGMSDDLPMGWMASCLDFLTNLEKHILDEYKFFYNNSFWYERLQVGKVSRNKAMDYAVGGPALRACGVNHDQRKRNPFYFYKDVSFEVPLGVNGYVYDRFLIYVEEIFQSIKIVTQVLDNIPAGKVISSEALHFQNYVQNTEITDDVLYRRAIKTVSPIIKKESLVTLESSNGLIDLWAKFDDNNLTERVKCSANSNKLLYLFENSIAGEKLEDLEIYWLSLGVKMSEVER
jgi:NADH-quinone oxidoreductase subunit C/D